MTVDTQGLTVRFGGRAVLNDVSVSFRGGEVVALIGPNGAGKSTLLRAIAGLQAAAGSILIAGRSIDTAEMLDSVAYMPQDTSATSSLTVLEVVLLGQLRSLGLRVPRTLVEDADALLARFGMRDLAGRTLDALSGGQRQLVYLAQALFRRPEILLLDEPTAALDLRHQLVVLETVRRTAKDEGIAVAVAMHDLSLAAQFADRFICLSDGGVDAAGPAESVLTEDRLRRVYSVHAEITRSANGQTIVTPIRAFSK